MWLRTNHVTEFKNARPREPEAVDDKAVAEVNACTLRMHACRVAMRLCTLVRQFHEWCFSGLAEPIVHVLPSCSCKLQVCIVEIVVSTLAGTSNEINLSRVPRMSTIRKLYLQCLDMAHRLR